MWQQGLCGKKVIITPDADHITNPDLQHDSQIWLRARDPERRSVTCPFFVMWPFNIPFSELTELCFSEARGGNNKNDTSYNSSSMQHIYVEKKRPCVNQSSVQHFSLKMSVLICTRSSDNDRQVSAGLSPNFGGVWTQDSLTNQWQIGMFLEKYSWRWISTKNTFVWI